MAKADVRITLGSDDFRLIMEVLQDELSEAEALVQEANLGGNEDDKLEAGTRYYTLERLIRELKG